MAQEQEAEEQRLLGLAKTGDIDAFNRLVAAHQDVVYGFAYRMLGRRADAEDATQEAFISAWKHVRMMRGNAFRAWIIRITRNKCYDIIRRGARRPTVSVDDEDANLAESLVSEEPSPEDRALSSEMREAIQRCINGLSPDHRTIVVLIDVMHYSYEQAAETVGIKIGSVKSRLNRARHRLRDCLRGVPGLLPSNMVGTEGAE